MNWVRLGFALVDLLVRLASALQQMKWYREGKADAYAEMDEEQRRRLEAAEAARVDADTYASGELHDPRRRD